MDSGFMSDENFTYFEEVLKVHYVCVGKMYDSIKAPYIEGNPIYPESHLRKDTHIQICILNHNCIKGYFHVREPDGELDIP
jgi:hypothetical protein